MAYERLTSDNAAVLFIDHQTGLANGVQTQSPPEFINNVRALVPGSLMRAPPPQMPFQDHVNSL
jgi:hypothetical protein